MHVIKGIKKVNIMVVDGTSAFSFERNHVIEVLLLLMLMSFFGLFSHEIRMNQSINLIDPEIKENTMRITSSCCQQ